MSSMRGGSALAVLLALACAACGYNAGLRTAERRSTVALEIFGNETFERDLERPVHDSLSRSLRDLTELRIVAPAEAEALIRGQIRSFRRRGGIRSPQNELLETGVYVEVEATLIDARSGRPLTPPARAGTWIGYILEGAANEPEARARALRHVADGLVLELFSPAR